MHIFDTVILSKLYQIVTPNVAPLSSLSIKFFVSLLLKSLIRLLLSTTTFVSVLTPERGIDAYRCVWDFCPTARQSHEIQSDSPSWSLDSTGRVHQTRLMASGHLDDLFFSKEKQKKPQQLEINGSCFLHKKNIFKMSQEVFAAARKREIWETTWQPDYNWYIHLL